VSVITDESGKAEVKLSFCTPHRHLEEWRYSSILFLTSTLYRCEQSATNPSRFSPSRKKWLMDCPCTKRWMCILWQ